MGYNRDEQRNTLTYSDVGDGYQLPEKHRTSLYPPYDDKYYYTDESIPPDIRQKIYRGLFKAKSRFSGRIQIYSVKGSIAYELILLVFFTACCVLFFVQVFDGIMFEVNCEEIYGEISNVYSYKSPQASKAHYYATLKYEYNGQTYSVDYRQANVYTTEDVKTKIYVDKNSPENYRVEYERVQGISLISLTLLFITFDVIEILTLIKLCFSIRSAILIKRIKRERGITKR